jgi:phage terminase small subunit
MACDNMAKYWYYGELLEAHRDDFPECGPYLCRGGSGGVIKSPYHQYQKDCLAMALQIFSRFGMTPADRSKLSVKGEDGAVNGLDELIS